MHRNSFKSKAITFEVIRNPTVAGIKEDILGFYMIIMSAGGILKFI